MIHPTYIVWICEESHVRQMYKNKHEGTSKDPIRRTSKDLEEGQQKIRIRTSKRFPYRKILHWLLGISGLLGRKSGFSWLLGQNLDYSPIIHEFVIIRWLSRFLRDYQWSFMIIHDNWTQIKIIVKIKLNNQI